MPFDSTEIPRRDEPIRPTPIGPRRRSGNAASALVLVLAILLLAMPFSMGALVDIVRYLRGN